MAFFKDLQLQLDSTRKVVSTGKHREISRCKYNRYGSCVFEGDAQELFDHVTTEHMKGVVYTCQRCGMDFVRDHLLNEHLLEIHDVKRKPKNRSGKWTCRFEHCDKEFKSRGDLWSHKRTAGHHKQMLVPAEDAFVDAAIDE